VEDAALVAAVIAGADAKDSATLAHWGACDHGWDPGHLESVVGIRIGVPRRCIADRAEMSAVLPLLEEALSRLSRAGARVIDPCDLPSAEQLNDVRSCVFRTEFKAALDDFLEAHESPCGIASMDALVAWNERHPEAIPYGQSLLLAANKTTGLDHPDYVVDRRRDIALSRTAGIDASLAMSGADVLIAPMGSAAKCTGKAGAPALAIPAGLDRSGTPFGVVLFASAGNDRRLIAIASAVERVIGDRRVPRLA
jgi:amidase